MEFFYSGFDEKFSRKKKRIQIRTGKFSDGKKFIAERDRRLAMKE